MKDLHLFAQQMTDRAAAHDHLAEVLALPAWYGRNLDALWDLLGEWNTPAHIHLYGCQLLDDYGMRIAKVMSRAVAQNPTLALTLHYGDGRPV